MTECNQVFVLGSSGNVYIGTTKSGTLVANFTLIIDEGGIVVKAFGRVAERVRDNVRKGSKVFIQGALSVEKWTDSEQKKRSKTVVIASNITVVPIPLILVKLWPRSTDARVTDSILRIMERRAKLLGLDAPQKIAETDAQGNDAPRQARAILHAKLLG